MATETRICPVGDHPFEYDMRSRGPRPTFCTPEHQWKAAADRARARQAALTRRTCARCREEKDASAFGGVTNPYCRPCHTEYERERRKVNGQQNPEYTRAINLRRYGLTIAQFDAMLTAQDSQCAICQTRDPGGQGWHVDHDHRCCNTRKTSCGRCIRGILCSRCNIAIGNLRDNEIIIQAALDYVIMHRSRLESLVDLPPDPALTGSLPEKYMQAAASGKVRNTRKRRAQAAAPDGRPEGPAPSLL